MRLLEFNRDTGGANPQSRPAKKPPSKKTARAVRLTKPAATPELSGKVLPLKAGETAPTVSKPIDLEQLQQRIEVLEHRIQARAEDSAEHPASRDLEILRKRVERLQHNVHSELWAAKQREHAMLKILSKPSFKMAMKQRIERFRSKQLPASSRRIVAIFLQWWQGSQPNWWQAFAKAWQDSLDKARGLPHS